MSDETTKQQEINFGHHSGIPECCIEQYVNSSDAERVAQNEKARLKSEELGHEHLWDYMPCDKCLESGEAVKMHRCTPGCGIEDIYQECGISEKQLQEMFNMRLTEILKLSSDDTA